MKNNCRSKNLKLTTITHLAAIVILCSFGFALPPSIAAEQSCEQAAQIMSRGIKEKLGAPHQVEIFRQALAQCETLPGGHFNLAVALLAQGNAEESLFQFQLAKKQSDDPATCLGLANALLTKGDIDGARAEYQALLDKDSKNSDAMVGLAVVNFREKKSEQTEVLLTKAISASPDNVVAALNYGILLQNDGKLKEAIDVLSRSAEKAKDNLEINLRLASVLLEAGRLDEAGTILTRLQVQAPNNPDVLTNQGIFLQQRDQNDAAKKILEQAHTLIPKNRAVIVTLASVLHNLSEDVRSRALIEEALLYYPDDTSVLNAAAWFFIETGDLAQAETLLQKSIAQDIANKRSGSSPTRSYLAHSYLAKLYEHQGEQEKAAEQRRLSGENVATEN